MTPVGPVSPKKTVVIEKCEEKSCEDGIDDNSDLAEAGVNRIRVINEVLTTYGQCNFIGYKISPAKWLLLALIFVQGYASGLDGSMTLLPQTYAVSEFNQSSLNSTINTVKTVVAAAVIIPYARISDRIGRMESWFGALILFTVGRVLCTAAPDIGTFFIGVVFTQLGYSGFRFLAAILTADISELRHRTIFMNIYEMPIIINLWISGDIVAAVSGGKHNWRWDFGIGAISVPITTALLISAYAVIQLVAQKHHELPPLRFRKPGQAWWKAIYDFMVHIDLLGILLFSASLSLILIPLTIAGGAETRWRHWYIVLMMVVGGLLFFAFVGYEWYLSPNSMIPKQKLERTFYFAVALETIWRVAVNVELDYVSFVLKVAFNQTTKSAQRLGQLYNFMQVVTSVGVGVALHYWPHPKPFVVAGALIGLLGMGLMYRYRTAYDGIGGYIAADTLVGLGGGLLRFPAYTLVHASLPANKMSVSTGFIMTFYLVGGSIGSAVGGAVWTQRLANELIDNVGPSLAMQIYENPYQVLAKYPLGSETRDLILNAYNYIQRLLIIVGISLAALVVPLTLGLRSYVVENKRNFTPDERQSQIDRMDANWHSKMRTLIGAW